jgi:iron complex transport system substrate-binding protein
MRKKLFLFLIIGILAIFAAGCGSEETDKSADKDNDKAKETETMKISHQLGETEVEVNPEKVVVFDFGILDSLDKLGVEVTGLPQASVPEYLSKYKDSKYENVGSLKEPDFEKIAEIDPDLIIISSRQMNLYDEFAKLGPTIFMGVDTANYIDSFKDNMNKLGKIFDKEDKINKEIKSIENRIAALQKKAGETDGKALIILANEGNISAYGPGSRFGLIHDVFGLKPSDENLEVSTHGQNISPEFIAEKNPEYLFVIDRGAVVGGQSSAEQIVETTLVKNTSAYKNGNIIYLDANYWYLSGGGLISVSEMIRQIEKAL